MGAAQPAATAQFLVAFFDELQRWGVRDVVISPGSRSTPLAMTAYELSRKHPGSLRVFIDVDERGAAFFALGIAKASGRSVALVCTSGTALANYYPAVLEAESSRIPLLVLSGDRPPLLQGLGAPQTCDQLKIFSDHVKSFRQMPLPADDAASLSFARQAAREACIAAGGRAYEETSEKRLAGFCSGAPVHLNFPFEEPLKPDFSDIDWGAQNEEDCSFGCMRSAKILDRGQCEAVSNMIAKSKTIVVAGEGSCATQEEVFTLLKWANEWQLPVLADPLSGLRSFDDVAIIDNYDCLLGVSVEALQELNPTLIIRFGRYPVSKKATQFLAASTAYQIVVDVQETRDFNAATDLFVECEPLDFVRALALSEAANRLNQEDFFTRWISGNTTACECLTSVEQAEEVFEGSFVRQIVKDVPEGSCLFAANSMSVRAIDSFYTKEDKRVTLLCNRGLNGIDGTLSTALGAAQEFSQTTLITGDLTLLHDINAFALQRELRVQHSYRLEKESEAKAPSIVVVLLNNNGGAIFDMLPQKSEDDYFERLFLTPQDVDFAAAAQTFGVPYRCVREPESLRQAYQECLDTPGISLIEVPVTREGLKDRYAPYWSLFS